MHELHMCYYSKVALVFFCPVQSRTHPFHLSKSSERTSRNASSEAVQQERTTCKASADEKQAEKQEEAAAGAHLGGAPAEPANLDLFRRATRVKPSRRRSRPLLET